MQVVFKACKKLFAALPLAACIAGKTLVLHGGELTPAQACSHMSSPVGFTQSRGEWQRCLMVTFTCRLVPQAGGAKAGKEAATQGSSSRGRRGGAGELERPTRGQQRRHRPLRYLVHSQHLCISARLASPFRHCTDTLYLCTSRHSGTQRPRAVLTQGCWHNNRLGCEAESAYTWSVRNVQVRARPSSRRTSCGRTRQRSLAFR